MAVENVSGALLSLESKAADTVGVVPIIAESGEVSVIAVPAELSVALKP